MLFEKMLVKSDLVVCVYIRKLVADLVVVNYGACHGIQDIYYSVRHIS